MHLLPPSCILAAVFCGGATFIVHQSVAVADTTWTAGSTQTLVLDFVVADALTIEEGVTVRLGANAKLIVVAGGSIQANGTEEDPILFTPIGADRWGGIRFDPGGAGAFRHAIIEHVGPCAVAIHDASPMFDRCEIHDVASASNVQAACGFSITASSPVAPLTRPTIRGCLIDGVLGAPGSQPAAASAGTNGPNGADGTFVSPNADDGGGGGGGGVGASGTPGGQARGISVGAVAGATLLGNRIRGVVGGSGGTGGTGGKGGKGGNGGDGVAGAFVGSGGNGANGGAGGKGGTGGVGGVATALMLASANNGAVVVDGLLIDMVVGGQGGIGGAGGAGGNGGSGGDGADCSVPGCNAGNGGSGGDGGKSGAGGQRGPGGASRSVYVEGMNESLAHLTVANLVAGSGAGVAGSIPPPPSGSDCFVPHSGTGCDDALCTATVCGVDLYCCNVTWDQLCANEATAMCNGCTACPPAEAQPGAPGGGGTGGNGGEAVFEAQDGDDGSDGDGGATGLVGVAGMPGAARGVVADDGAVELVNSVLSLDAGPSVEPPGATITAFVPLNESTISVSSCCVFGFDDLDDDSDGTVSLTSTLLSDPKFADAAESDFRLAADSPCIDAGTTVLLEFERSAHGWQALAQGSVALAFDEFAPGIVNGTGCLLESPALIELEEGFVALDRADASGSPLCAITDGSTPTAVADAQLGPIGTPLTLTFDPPVVAFYTYYGSLSSGTTANLIAYAGEELVATFTSASAPTDVLATGHGFVSTRPIDRVEVKPNTDPNVVLGAFVGLNANDQSLGVVDLRGYQGPNGSAVTHDLGLGFDGLVLFTDADGLPRIVDGDDDGEALADMGAFEFDPSMLCQADLDGTSVVDAADLAILLGAWGSCGSCAQDLDGNGAVNAADLAILLGAWGGCP